MELTKANDNSFNLTPKLKSSPVPISFISFNIDDTNCIHCGDTYTMTSASYSHFNIRNEQKYCRKCLSCYLTNITDKNIYLDVYIFTRNLECSEHEISRTKEPQNIQECCSNCLEILLFKQISIYYIRYNFINVIESEKHCKLCGKLLHDNNHNDFILCSDCYLISYGYIESTLIKKPIPIIYLPWWDNKPYCMSCQLKLKFTSDSQKYCEYCLIFYIGCRYCLTTNIIFGITNQSQCKKCKTKSSIIFVGSGNSDLDDFLINLRLEIYNRLKIAEFVDNIKNNGKYYRPNYLLNVNLNQNGIAEIFMEWIPYSQFTNVKEIAKGGFGIIYQATWLEGSMMEDYPWKKRRKNETVILKKFKNSQGISKYFLNEVNILIFILFIM
jgi:hypothetical protein